MSKIVRNGTFFFEVPNTDLKIGLMPAIISLANDGYNRPSPTLKCSFMSSNGRTQGEGA